jgi:16S rRNA (adenine1518-N6/adenine1519-N6)-dimethyltransferase
MTTPDRSLAAGRGTFADLLRRHGIRPDKRLGQTFLFDPASLDKVVAAAALDGSETVLEVGAGVGSLTQRLSDQAALVLAVEIDRRLIPALEETVSACRNVRVIREDILALDLDRLVGERPYCVVANIPYQITSRLIRHLLEAVHPPRALVLTIQREVAERIIARPGQMSLLALSVQLYGVPTIVDRIPAGAFYPAPKVESAVLRVDVHPQPRLPAELIAPFFRLARLGFGQKRKQLRNALAAGMGVPSAVVAGWQQQAGLPPSSRAQELGLADWERLTRVGIRELGVEWENPG